MTQHAPASNPHVLPQGHVTILSRNGDITVDEAIFDGDTVALKLATAATLSDSPRLRVRMTEKQGTTIRALTRIEGQGTYGPVAAARLQLVALHATEGETALRRFLFDTLGVRDVRGRFHEGSGGVYYRFPPRLADTFDVVDAPPSDATRQATSDADPYADRRDHPRVAVRVRVRYRDAFNTWTGQAYNVSESGVHVRTTSGVPEVGARIQLVYPVHMHAKPFRVQIAGVVAWNIEGTSADQGGGFGLKIEKVHDGCGGKAWADYVANELRFGGPAILA